MVRAIACVASCAIAVVAFQQPQQQGPDPASVIRKGFEQVGGWIAKSADLVPADKYTFKPTASVRTFGQLVAHVADGYNYYCGLGAGRPNVQWTDAVEKGATDKATVTAKLKQALDGCTRAYGTTANPAPLIENFGHANLHYGNIITYMRVMGLTPPSS